MSFAAVGRGTALRAEESCPYRGGAEGTSASCSSFISSVQKHEPLHHGQGQLGQPWWSAAVQGEQVGCCARLSRVLMVRMDDLSPLGEM